LQPLRTALCSTRPRLEMVGRAGLTTHEISQSVRNYQDQRSVSPQWRSARRRAYGLVPTFQTVRSRGSDRAVLAGKGLNRITDYVRLFWSIAHIVTSTPAIIAHCYTAGSRDPRGRGDGVSTARAVIVMPS
jgi:hypothetical protein